MLTLLSLSDVSDFSEATDIRVVRITVTHAYVKNTVHEHIVTNPQGTTYAQHSRPQTKHDVDESSAVRLRKCNILLRKLPHLVQKQRCRNRDAVCRGTTATLND